MEKIYFTEKTVGDYAKNFIFFILKLIAVVIAIAFLYRYCLIYSLEYSVAKNFLQVFGF